MTELTQFTCFKKLPIEIRLRIWGLAANNHPRTIDLWTDWVRCNIDETTFYCQKYFCELSDISPPAVLHACRESRSEALKYYIIEYATEMFGIKMDARMYINYATDILIPRGYWNMISFEHFVSRAVLGGLATLAVDISGNFWIDNLRDYVAMNNWLVNGIQELYLYESKEGMWKESNYLDRFRQRTNGVRRELEFQDLEKPDQDLKDVMKFLEHQFDIIEELPQGENDTPVERKPSYLQKIDPTPAKELLRPQVKFMKLLDKDPRPPFISGSKSDAALSKPEQS